MKTTLISLSLALPLCAQSIEGIDPSAAARPVVEIPATDPEDEAQADLISMPSRYAAGDLDAYLNSLLSSFAMRNRDRDPFGRHQDPNYEPPKPVIAKKAIKKFVPEPVTPFSDIVEAIPITAIISSQGKFLVGSRAFGLGSRLKLNIGKSEPLTIHVVKIDSNRVVFRHATTRETAAHVLRVLPGGMVPGVSGVTPPDGVITPEDAIDISTQNTLSSRR